MSGIEDWEVGKYYSEPIYKTLPDNTFMDPLIHEYFVHGPTKAFNKHVMLSLIT